MLKGKLEISLGSTVHMCLEAGDSLYFTSRTPHALRVVLMVSPPSFWM